jgi:hypothetical protein
MHGCHHSKRARHNELVKIEPTYCNKLRSLCGTHIAPFVSARPPRAFDAVCQIRINNHLVCHWHKSSVNVHTCVWIKHCEIRHKSRGTQHSCHVRPVDTHMRRETCARWADLSSSSLARASHTLTATPQQRTMHLLLSCWRERLAVAARCLKYAL